MNKFVYKADDTFDINENIFDEPSEPNPRYPPRFNNSNIYGCVIYSETLLYENKKYDEDRSKSIHNVTNKHLYKLAWNFIHNNIDFKNDPVKHKDIYIINTKRYVHKESETTLSNNNVESKYHVFAYGSVLYTGNINIRKDRSTKISQFPVEKIQKQCDILGAYCHYFVDISSNKIFLLFDSTIRLYPRRIHIIDLKIDVKQEFINNKYQYFYQINYVALRK
jgi:hypothetical protein